MARHLRAARPLTSAATAGALVALAPWAAAEAPGPPTAFRSDAAPAWQDPVQWLLAQALPSTGPLRAAPIRWSGNLGFEQRFARADDSGQRRESIEFANVDASSYLGQPWLAQLRASLGVVASQERLGTDPAADPNADDRNRTAAVTGGASISVFPTSRFPFLASFDVSDSRAGGEVTASDYRSRLATARQSYRSPLGDSTYVASVQRSVLLSDSFGRDVVSAVQGTAQRTFGLQTVDVNAAYSQNRRERTGDGSDIGRVSAHHSWRPDDDATLETFASYSSTEFLAAQPGLERSRTRFLQLNSIGTWRPDEDSPLFVSGGVRLSNASFGAEAEGESATTAGAHVAASYAFNAETHLVAGASVARIAGERTSDLVATQSLAATYSPRPLSLGAARYSWTTSGSLSNQAGGLEGGQRSLGLAATHQLSRGIDVTPALSVTASVQQGAGVQDEPVVDPTRTLQHSATVSARLRPGAASDAFLSATLGDSRSRGGREETFRLYNLQASGQLEAGPYSLVTANLTVQGVRQKLGVSEGEQDMVIRSGTVGYENRRVMGVTRLRGFLAATFNDLQLDSRLQGDATAPRDPYQRVLEGRLEYGIGRLDFRIGTRLATVSGKNDRQIFFRVNRQFGP